LAERRREDQEAYRDPGENVAASDGDRGNDDADAEARQRVSESLCKSRQT